MKTDAASAAAAYGRSLGFRSEPVSGGIDGRSGSFSDLLKRAADAAVNTGQSAEQVTFQSIGGEKKLEMLDVVAAINSAEITVESAVAVRDRIINAYQEIMRMPM